jgi:U3 small nucleolar RNA-associated protein 7
MTFLYIWPSATEVLLPTEEGFIRPEGNEKTYRIKQQEIINEVDLNTSKHAMDLQLTKFGPYNTSYSKNGRYFIKLGCWWKLYGSI